MSRAVALLALAVAAAACGSSSATAVSSPSPSAAVSSPSPARDFHLSGINTSASGTVLLTTGAGTITVELKITGLAADSSHISHIHGGSCQQKGAVVFALNQVVADGTGAADTKTTLQASFPPATGHWYVVVHAGPDMQGPNATYLLCGNLF